MSNYVIYNGNLISEDELKHYGVPGMKWGVRKAKSILAGTKARLKDAKQFATNQTTKVKKKFENSKSKPADPQQQAIRKAKIKKGVVIGAAAVGAVVAAKTAVKVAKVVQNRRAINAGRAAVNTFMMTNNMFR